VYRQCFEKPKQALLVHRPRMASLRPRTRLDRQRTLESDIKDRELGFQLAVNRSRHNNKKESKTATKRETNRPFWGLTQVCRQVRTEFRPIYMQKQEIGMDVTEIVMYLQTFYPEKSDEFAKLIKDDVRGPDLPFNGNLTIAVGDKPTDLERLMNGVEVIPLLDLWANSWKIEAGFGRYLKANYLPQTDGEAKDLYVPISLPTLQEHFTDFAQLPPLRPPRPQEPSMLRDERRLAFNLALPCSCLRHPASQARPSHRGSRQLDSCASGSTDRWYLGSPWSPNRSPNRSRHPRDQAVHPCSVPP
jgi:hypothetical protein